MRSIPHSFISFLSAALALTIYLLTLSPDLTWANFSSDGGELITAAATWGVPHPPGYPTYVLLGHLVNWLPLGTAVYRFNLFSALCVAGAFYAVHRGRPFYDDLVAFMTSGPCLPMALERADAVATLRQVIGATDPAEAAPGTIRKLYAESKGRNAIHASDSDENAAREVAFFFPEGELAGLWG